MADQPASPDVVVTQGPPTEAKDDVEYGRLEFQPKCQACSTQTGSDVRMVQYRAAGPDRLLPLSSLRQTNQTRTALAAQKPVRAVTERRRQAGHAIAILPLTARPSGGAARRIGVVMRNSAHGNHRRTFRCSVRHAQANLEAGGLSSFRENEDSATYFTPNQYAALFRTLANDEIANSINAADSQRPPVFTYLC